MNSEGLFKLSKHNAIKEPVMKAHFCSQLGVFWFVFWSMFVNARNLVNLTESTLMTRRAPDSMAASTNTPNISNGVLIN